MEIMAAQENGSRQVSAYTIGRKRSIGVHS